jgi:hypothetical protein
MLKPSSTLKVISFRSDPKTSKMAIIYAAVSGQLRRDGRWPPDDLDKVMGDPPYRYNETTLDNFFRGVADAMDDSLPPLLFQWDDKFVRGGLKLTVAGLMAAIAGKSKWGA